MSETSRQKMLCPTCKKMLVFPRRIRKKEIPIIATCSLCHSVEAIDKFSLIRPSVRPAAGYWLYADPQIAKEGPAPLFIQNVFAKEQRREPPSFNELATTLEGDVQQLFDTIAELKKASERISGNASRQIMDEVLQMHPQPESFDLDAMGRWLEFPIWQLASPIEDLGAFWNRNSALLIHPKFFQGMLGFPLGEDDSMQMAFQYICPISLQWNSVDFAWKKRMHRDSQIYYNIPNDASIGFLPDEVRVGVDCELGKTGVVRNGFHIFEYRGPENRFHLARYGVNTFRDYRFSVTSDAKEVDEFGKSLGYAWECFRSYGRMVAVDELTNLRLLMLTVAMANPTKSVVILTHDKESWETYLHSAFKYVGQPIQLGSATDIERDLSCHVLAVDLVGDSLSDEWIATLHRRNGHTIIMAKYGDCIPYYNARLAIQIFSYGKNYAFTPSVLSSLLRIPIASNASTQIIHSVYQQLRSIPKGWKHE